MTAPKDLAPVVKLRRIKKEAASSMDDRHTRNGGQQQFVSQQKCQHKVSSNNLLTISKFKLVNESLFFLNLCIERDAIKRPGPSNNRDTSPRILQITKVKMARRP